jgi:uncharacterized membrane protein YhaH (DUF805 family)
MTAGQYLFGFNGRVNRAKWWLLILIQLGATIVYYIAALMLVGTSVLSVMGSGSAESSVAGAGGSAMLLILLSFAYAVFMFITWLAVTAKRLHDRDKSGIWILLFAVGPWVCYGISLAASADNSGGIGGVFALAGLAITVWAFVELGCLRGTAGPNGYGPDPLALMQYTPAPPVLPA